MSKVSLCMIIRNEEIILEKSLLSIINIADEIIIVDTGSTDRSIEITKKFTDKIYHFAWIDDFAAARNYAQSLASQEYILRWDADCVLRPGDMQKLLDAKTNDFLDSDLYFMNYVEGFEVDSDNNYQVIVKESLFFFYKKQHFHWQYPIHEELISNDILFKPKTVTNDNIYVMHHRKESKKDWRTKQNLNILKQNLKPNSKNYERMLYFYARELYFDRQYDKAIKYYQELFKLATTIDIKAYILEKIVFSLFYKNAPSQISEFANDLETIRHPRITLLKADISCLSDPIQARIYYIEYLQKPFYYSFDSFEYDVERFEVHPYIQLGKILIHGGEIKEAEKYLNVALNISKSVSTLARIKALLHFC